MPFGWTSGLQKIKNVTTNRQYAFLAKQYLAKETIFARNVKPLCHHLTFVSSRTSLWYNLTLLLLAILGIRRLFFPRLLRSIFEISSKFPLLIFSFFDFGSLFLLPLFLSFPCLIRLLSMTECIAKIQNVR